MSEPATKSTILVTGDAVRDIYIYKGDREHPAQKGTIEPHFSDRPGGARLLYNLIRKAWSGTTDFGLQITPGTRRPTMQTLWQASEGGTKEEHEDAAKNAKPAPVWRVANSLGYYLSGKGAAPQKSPEADLPHTVWVLDDAGLGFRDRTSSPKRSVLRLLFCRNVRGPYSRFVFPTYCGVCVPSCLC